MASASTTSTTAPKKPRKMPTTVKKELAAKRKSTATKPKVAKPRVLFLPGSLNDQISKLKVGESLGHVRRFVVENGPTLSSQAQSFFKAKNSVLSGGIAKVRSAPEHKDKRFTMERGSYMTASNDAMFAFLTITRTE
jgi:hypothetical protein